MKIELTHNDGGKITIFSDHIASIYDAGTHTQIFLSGGSGVTVKEKYETILDMLKHKPAKTKQGVGRG